MADLTLTGDSSSLVQAYGKAIESVNRYNNTLKLNYETIKQTVTVGDQQVKAIDKINVSYKGALAGVVEFSKNLSQLNVTMTGTVKAASEVVARQNALMSAWQSGTVAVTEFGRAARAAYAAMDAAMDSSLAKAKQFSAELKAQMEQQMRAQAAATRNNYARTQGGIPANNINPLTGQPYLNQGQSASARQLQAQMAAKVNAGARANQSNEAINRYSPLTGYSYKVEEGLGRVNAQMIQGQMMAQQAVNQVSMMTRYNMDQTNEAIKKATASTQQFHLSWSTVGRLVGLHVMYRLVFGIMNSIKDGITGSIELQKRLGEIQTINQNGPGGVPESSKMWLQTIRGSSEKYGMGLTDTTESAYQALSNQVINNTREFAAFGNAIGKFAVVSRSEIPAAGDLISSALNSFQMDTSKSEHVAASFFKTIEIGRVRAEELANTYGRVAPMAHEIGIQFDQLNSLIAVTTIRGIKSSEALTQIRGVMNALAKPTKEMKELFAEWGVTSAEAAIKQFGAFSVLQKIVSSAKLSSEMSELFPNMRGKNLMSILSAPGAMKDLDDALGKIQNSSESYNKAYESVKDNVGKRLEIELTKVANIFKVDIGQAALASIDKITNGFKLLVPAVKLAAGAMQTLLISGGIAGISKLISMVGGLISKFKLLGMAALSLPTWIFGIGTAVIGGLVYLMGSESRRIEAIDKMVQEKLDGIDERYSKIQESMNKEFIDVREASDKKRQLWHSENADYISMIQERISKNAELEKENLKTVQHVGDQTKKNIDEVTNSYKSQAQELRANAKKNIKEANDLPEKIGTQFFQQSLDASNDPTRLRMMIARISQLSDKRKGFLANGDQEGYDSTSNSIDSLVKDAISTYRKAASKKKLTAEDRQTLTYGSAIQSISQAYSQEQSQRYQLAQSQNNQAYMDERNAKVEEASKEQIDYLNKGITDFIQKRKDGFKDETTLTQEYDKQIDSLNRMYAIAKNLAEQRKQLGLKTASGLTGEAYTAALQDTSNQYSQDSERARQLYLANYGQNGYVKEKMLAVSDLKLKEQRDKNQGQIDSLDAHLEGVRKNIDDKILQIKTLSSSSTYLSGLMQKALPSALSGNVDKTYFGNLLEPMEEQRGSLAKYAFTAAANGFKGSISKVSDDTATLDDYKSARDNLQELMGFFKDKKYLKVGSVEEQEYARFESTLKILNEFIANNATAMSTNGWIRDKQAYIGRKEELRGKLISEWGSPEQKLTDSMVKLGLTFTDATKTIKELMAEWKKDQQPKVPGKAYGGLIRGYSYGGLNSQDTVPIMAANGEFIVNSSSSRRFRTQLFTMNQGLMSSAPSRNAGDSFSFGDINVDARGREDADGIAEAVYTTLKRKMNRGEWASLS